MFYWMSICLFYCADSVCWSTLENNFFSLNLLPNLDISQEVMSSEEKKRPKKFLGKSRGKERDFVALDVDAFNYWKLTYWWYCLCVGVSAFIKKIHGGEPWNEVSRIHNSFDPKNSLEGIWIFTHMRTWDLLVVCVLQFH